MAIDFRMEFKIPHGDFLPSLEECFQQDLTVWKFIYFKRNKSYLILPKKATIIYHFQRWQKTLSSGGAQHNSNFEKGGRQRGFI